MVYIKLLLMLIAVKECICFRYPLIEKYCPSLPLNTRRCFDQFELQTRDNNNPSGQSADSSAIFLKISDRPASILDPTSYFTIVTEVCKLMPQYRSFLECVYPMIENCLGEYREEVLPEWRNFLYGFTYLCRYHRNKELSIQCYKNNTLQGPTAETRIKDFSNQVEQCRINKHRTLQLAVTGDTQEDIEKNIEHHCSIYHTGFDCVRQTFAERCHRTRDHIEEFYYYLSPEYCSAPFCFSSAMLLCLCYLFAKYFI